MLKQEWDSNQTQTIRAKDDYISVATNYSVAYEVTLSNRVSDFHDFCVFFASKGNLFLLLFYSTVPGVVPRDGRKKSPRTSSLCSLYFITFGIIEPIPVILKIEYRLSRR